MAGAHSSKRTIMFNNFIGGLAWGFGTVVGATVVVAVVVWILSVMGVFEPIKEFIQQSQSLTI